jgi:hypothetical protein
MTEEVTQEKEKIFSDEEIHEMFDTSFLPKLQEFAKRSKEKLFKDKSPIYFHAQMKLQFSDLEIPLTYESIKDKTDLQLLPVFQEDIDKAAEEAKKAEEEKKNEAPKED